MVFSLWRTTANLRLFQHHKGLLITGVGSETVKGAPFLLQNKEQ